MKKIPISHCNNLSEIINTALAGTSDFFVCHFPGSEYLFYDTGCHLSEAAPCNDDAFTIGTFNGTTYYLSPGEQQDKICFQSLPPATAKKDYIAGAEHIISELKISGGKTVYSRVEHRDAPSDVGVYYLRLMYENPGAYVFIFRAGKLGTWIGASPELLLRSYKDSSVESVSLAGTRPATDCITEDMPAKQWDNKNLEEQQLVTDTIMSQMKQSGYTVSQSELLTRRAGAVEHLCREIKGFPSSPTCVTPLKLAQLLAPTPALCGYPKEISMQRIKQLEKHDRICYGGYSGIINKDGNVALYVTLRCALLSGTEAALYLGGGLTAHSVAEQEWEETCAKSRWYEPAKK